MIISEYFTAPLLAFIIARAVKIILKWKKTNKRGLARLNPGNGGMPSEHVASVLGVTTIVGLGNGFSEPLFAVCTVFSLIVMTDAVTVRRTAGEVGKVVQEFTKGKKPYVSHGHRFIEIFIGAIIGVLVGIAIYFVSKNPIG